MPSNIICSLLTDRESSLGNSGLQQEWLKREAPKGCVPVSRCLSLFHPPKTQEASTLVSTPLPRIRKFSNTFSPLVVFFFTSANGSPWAFAWKPQTALDSWWQGEGSGPLGNSDWRAVCCPFSLSIVESWADSPLVTEDTAWTFINHFSGLGGSLLSSFEKRDCLTWLWPCTLQKKKKEHWHYCANGHFLLLEQHFSTAAVLTHLGQTVPCCEGPFCILNEVQQPPWPLPTRRQWQPQGVIIGPSPDITKRPLWGSSAPIENNCPRCTLRESSQWPWLAFSHLC